MQLALGLIETKGLIGAIEAADAMAKAANIKILNKEKSTAALITIKIEGEVAAVKSAVDAGAAAAQRVGQLVSAHIIPRPHDDLDSIVNQTDSVITVSKKASFTSLTKKKPTKTPLPVVEKRESVIKAGESVGNDMEEDNVELLSDDSSEELTTQETVENDQQDAFSDVSPSPAEPEQPVENVDEKTSGLDENKKEESDAISHLDRLREEAKAEVSSDDDELDTELDTGDGVSIPPLEELEKLNVHELRKLARSIKTFPIKGREISKANRGTLLDLFSHL